MKKYIPYGIAAAILALLGVVWLLNPSQSSLDFNEILKKGQSDFVSSIDRYKEGLEVNAFADPDAEIKDSLNIALGLIETGDYNQARKILSGLIERFPENSKALYYYGYNQLNLGNYTIAIEALSKVKNGTDDSVKYDAHYYYAIALMKLNDNYSSAKKEFKVIANDVNSPYMDTAKGYIRLLE